MHVRARYTADGQCRPARIGRRSVRERVRRDDTPGKISHAVIIAAREGLKHSLHAATPVAVQILSVFVDRCDLVAKCTSSSS